MQPTEPSTPATGIEIEQKYRLDNPAEIERLLGQIGARPQPIERHADTYYRHPARDFAQTREALRIRRVVVAGDQGQTLVTYKGPLWAGAIKTRPELEWRIDPCDPNGANMAELLGHLGFMEALTVTKTRRPFAFQHAGRALTVTLDDAGPLGHFSEIETLARGSDEFAACHTSILAIAAMLGLSDVEPRSYLTMALIAAGAGSTDVSD
jgi:adenylate cyclase class 2